MIVHLSGQDQQHTSWNTLRKKLSQRNVIIHRKKLATLVLVASAHIHLVNANITIGLNWINAGVKAFTTPQMPVVRLFLLHGNKYKPYSLVTLATPQSDSESS